MMGRTALYRDPGHLSPRTEVQLDAAALLLRTPDGRTRRWELDGAAAVIGDGAAGHNDQQTFASSPGLWPGHRSNDRRGPRSPDRAAAPKGGVESRSIGRRFVRMLTVERGTERHVLITPPEHGAVAPNVVRVPDAPASAIIVDPPVWEVLADWLASGGRFAACSIADLARLVAIATPQFAVLIGEVAAQVAIELALISDPLRGGSDVETALEPLTVAARTSPRAVEALVAAHAHAAGATRRRRRLW
jgi:hypothetical protein